jgi:hypothetical protein
MRWARHGQFLRYKGVVDWRDGSVAAGFVFVHGLYQQSIYESMGAARRADLHRRIDPN